MCESGLKRCKKGATLGKKRSDIGQKKMQIIASSGVQKLFFTIFGSRDISKLKWGVIFQNV